MHSTALDALARLPGPRLPPSVAPSPEELLRGLRRRRPVLLRLLVRDARALASLFRLGGHQELGFASVGEFSESLGLSAQEGRTLFALGRALEGWPGLEERVLDGRLNPEKAASFARLLEVEGALRPGEGPRAPSPAPLPPGAPEPPPPCPWVDCAEEESTRDFQRRVSVRCEEALRGVPVERLSFLLSQAGMADFRRCRGLLSRRTNRRFTRGETLEILSVRYLEAEDPLLVRGRARRVPDTAPRGTSDPASDGTSGAGAGPDGSPGAAASRYVPAEVRRAVTTRAGGRCEFPRCGFDTWLDLAHLVPHRAGGSREAGNLLLLCGVHHRALDAGTLEVDLEEGRVRFRNPWGQWFEGPDLAARGGSARSESTRGRSGRSGPGKEGAK